MRPHRLGPVDIRLRRPPRAPCRPPAGVRAASARPPGGHRLAPPGLVTAEGGLMHNSPRVRRAMMPSQYIGAHSGVGGARWRRVDGPQPMRRQPSVAHHNEGHKSAGRIKMFCTWCLFDVERYAGHVRAIHSAHARRSSSASKCRPINTKADAAGGSPASGRTSSHWYTP